MKITLDFTSGSQDKQDTMSLLSGDKMTKSKAMYRPAPTDAVQVCTDCEFYNDPHASSSTCSKVVGVIDGNCVCDCFYPVNKLEM